MIHSKNSTAEQNTRRLLSASTLCAYQLTMRSIHKHTQLAPVFGWAASLVTGVAGVHWFLPEIV